MRVWSVRLCTLTRSLSGCCCGSVLRVRADHALLCIHQFHWSSQHRHFLRQAVVVSASYSPAPLHVTNALRHDLNGLETLNLDVLGMYPDLLVLPFPYHHSLVLRFPPRVYVSTFRNASVLHQLTVYPCIEDFVRMLQISLQWHGRAVYAPINSTSRGTGPASFDVSVVRVTLPDLEFVWSWRSLSIFHGGTCEQLGSSQSSLSLSYPSSDHGSTSTLSQHTLLNLLHFKLVYKELPEPKLFLISSQGWQSIPDCMLSKTIQLYQTLLAYPTYRMRSNPPSKLLCAS
ncbi:hypothetical protein BDR07DRAFT_109544 [Suillus spraguei]|nr:hypothetical protein BDR07DRAFT_109544 [Suillus spraguei]